MRTAAETPLGWDAGEGDYNPFLPAFHRDPFPFYRMLRESDPVHWNPPGIWVLTRHADVLAILKDPHTSSDFRNSDLYVAFRLMMGDDAPQERASSMLFRDPPDHTRLRGLVTKAFTAKRVEDLRPRIQEIVDQLVGSALHRGDVDLVADLAYPLPVQLICEMLGVPSEDHHRFHAWSADMVSTLDPMASAEVMDRAAASGEAFDAYFSELIGRRRHAGTDDLLCALVAAEQDGGGGRLSQEELLLQLQLILVAGHETTVHLIAGGMLALLRNPGEMRRLRADPSLIRTAVEELLRYCSPVQLTGRIPLRDMEIGGRTLARGQQVVALIGAANRDPEQFPDPDRLDLTRQPNRHIGFGGGIHHCLGASLARAEAQVAIRSLLGRTRAIELLVDEPEWRHTITLRGPASLPVRLTG